MKSLIIYSNPVPLMDSQDIELLYWQGANLWGNDKVSHAEQVEWVKDHHSHIVDSAKHPLDYLWWTEADEQLQFLAWCMEYVKSLEYFEEFKTYEGYSCPLVIAYDGTCSGLQHYSAMLRDEVGGSAVNLVDHERPADIYQQVADKVLKIVEKDAMSGTLDEVQKEEVGGGQRVHFGTRSMAQAWLAHGVTRKVVKRNVMTLAYGSGQYGFQEQIYEDTTKGNIHFKRFEKPCAKYMAKLVWQEVQTTVVSATEGMKYLKALAKVLTKHGLPVNWWTPLGLPVQQQYLKLVQKSFRTRFGDMVSWRGYYQDVADDESLDANGQKNGVAPNFIHSLDSTHLMMTVNEAGLSNYTTIHDSFGTSLGEARHLQKVIREQLYKLYTEYSPIEEFKKYVEEMTGEDLSDIPEPPKGSLKLENILTSSFIFH
jgi:DNA-directed RNA polymerase